MVFAGLAGAHVVLGRLSLRQAVEQAEVVVLARFESGVELWTAPDGSDRQDRYRVVRLETLKGNAPAEHFEFFPHAEGLPAFAAGDRALLFLERTGEHVEFAALAEHFPYYSTQGAGSEWIVPKGDAGTAILAVARRYVALPPDPGPGQDAALRQLLADSLGSGVATLHGDALNEAVRSRTLRRLETPADVAPFTRLARDPALPLSTRLLLIHELREAPGFSSDEAWDALLTEEFEKQDQLKLLRAAGGSDEESLSRWVASKLADEDPEIQREAARALTHPRHAARHAELAALARGADDTAARAAIRALGAQRSPEARAELEKLALELPAPRRRFAEAELRRP